MSDDTFTKVLIITVIILGTLVLFGRYQVVPVTGPSEGIGVAYKINRITGNITLIVQRSEYSVGNETK